MDTMSTATAAEPLHLVSHVLCPYVHRAAILLREKGVPFRRTNVDLQNKPEWFLKLSPRGKVPVLVVGDVPLFESAVIVEYIDEVHPPRVLPADPLERARQRAWIEVVNDLFMAQYKIATATTAADRAAAVAIAADLLARFEAEIRGDFFAGDAFGIVDVAIAPALTRFLLADAWLGLGLYAKVPKVAAWAARLEARPSVRETVPEGFAERFRALVKPIAA
ncbi:MAG: glutathione S-transferase family protein [Deltaproteobacteria bacterium]|nr:glutathione S-transferase family protein [Deltaproteobacteria bacterium]